MRKRLRMLGGVMNNVSSLPRSKNDWISAAELRVLIKANLGYNARQVTVKMSSSGQRFLDVYVRDAAVDLKKVNEFCRQFHTFTVDQSDYAEGQAVSVEITDEVKSAIAAPFVPVILAALDTLEAGNYGIRLECGKWLNRSERDMWISAGMNSVQRGTYIWRLDVEARQPWAIQALAYQLATV